MFAILLAPDFGFQVARRAALQSGVLKPSDLAGLIDSEDKVGGGAVKKQVQEQGGTSGTPSLRHTTLRGASSTDDKGWIVQADPRTLAAGVQIGMSATQAIARCEKISLLRREPDLERRAFRALLQFAGTIAPRIEATGAGIVTIDLRSAQMPTDLSELEDLAARALGDGMDSCGLDLVCGMAPNPELALLASRRADPICILQQEKTLPVTSSEGIGEGSESESESGGVGDLPLSVLNPPPPLAAILGTWGIDTVGQFVGLPRAELVERLGTAGAELWDQASGKGHRLLRLEREKVRYHQVRQLDFQIDSLEPLLFLLRRMLEELLVRIASDYLAPSSMALVLGFASKERRRSELRLPEPSCDIELLFRLLHTHLDGVTAGSPIEALSLELLPGLPTGKQQNLFERGIRDPHRLADTLAQIGAIVGPEHVGCPVSESTHQPDSFRVEPFDPSGEGGGQGGSENIDGSSQMDFIDRTPKWGLPLRRLRPPEPIDVLERRLPGATGRGRPAEIRRGRFPGRITDTAGPWLLSGDWWGRHGWRTEEWDVELAEGGLLRIARQGGKWQLEGVYG